MYAKIVTFWTITRDLCNNIEVKKTIGSEKRKTEVD